MTVLTIFKNEDYILFGADTRSTKMSDLEINNERKIESFTDTLCKIIPIKIGYIAGTGLEDLIFAVNGRTLFADSLNEILNIIIKTKKDFIIKSNGDEYIKEKVNNTSWIVTFKNNDKLNAAFFNTDKNIFQNIEQEIFVLSTPYNPTHDFKFKMSEEDLKKALKIKTNDKLKLSKIRGVAWTLDFIKSFSSYNEYVSSNFYLVEHDKNKTNKIKYFY
jgi:hypothetical protein